MAARRPRSMRVMGQKYDVSYPGHLIADASTIDSLDDDEGEVTLLGHCVADHNSIVISLDQGPDRMRETMVHEALHAMFNKARLTQTYGGKQEEILVGRLAPVLLLWLRDNPAVLNYLRERA